jgi:hypothetical protein
MLIKHGRDITEVSQPMSADHVSTVHILSAIALSQVLPSDLDCVPSVSGCLSRAKCGNPFISMDFSCLNLATSLFYNFLAWTIVSQLRFTNSLYLFILSFHLSLFLQLYFN